MRLVLIEMSLRRVDEQEEEEDEERRRQRKAEEALEVKSLRRIVGAYLKYLLSLSLSLLFIYLFI